MQDRYGTLTPSLLNNVKLNTELVDKVVFYVDFNMNFQKDSTNTNKLFFIRNFINEFMFQGTEWFYLSREGGVIRLESM